ncbi:transketolase [Fulvimarina endophytica]|uniref:Transketolase n=1 Tax=Fulvimarina endophytica TaxID=2293836 RepID=A0A371X596_9HYPH|nr:transketolase [Fulvimarina endophytica]RFC64403.1 transketolase [Fulvimarina endophytica]
MRKVPMSDLQSMAHAIRFLAMDAIERVGEGHQGVPLGMAEIATALYARHLKFDPSDPTWLDRDRVVLSNGHGSMLLYALNYLSGYTKIDIDAVRTFRELNSHCAGHPEIDQTAGIEMTTGLLGQGVASAVGMAVAEARLATRYPGLVNHRTWVFLGDGCLEEGMGQEAISLAGHLKLGKLTLLWDDNAITDDGATSLAISEDIPARFEAAHWHVQSVDGHDIEAVSAAMGAAKADPRPSMIACRTSIARGIARIEGRRAGHSGRITREDTDAARTALGWSAPAFEVPDDVLDAWRASGRRGARTNAAWREALSSDPQADMFLAALSGTGETWRMPLEASARALVGREQSTVHSSGEVCEAMREDFDGLQILCADLEAPTDHKRGRDAFTADDRSGSYVHCGVREHLMAAMANGIASHGGLYPVPVTYFAFTDYMRAAIRMAGLMGLPGLFVLSHDSIGVGRNGPTHQPVETLAGFRAMPNVLMMRPADGVETAEAWEIALERRTGPVLLALTKQAVPPVRNEASENRSRRGAYVLVEPATGDRDATILATGSEVFVALRAQSILADEGICAAVVSMPCWELFAEQDADYRAQVLGQAPRFAVEAAVRFGWDQWIGTEGGFVGMTGYGASAAAETLYDHFGITPERVAETVRRTVSKA